MKRDMDLIRLLLLKVEGEEQPELTGYTEDQRTYHLALLIEAGLVDGSVSFDASGFPDAVQTTKLTWEGHEFLDAARNDAIWRKALEKAKVAGATVSIAILKQLLARAAKDCLGID